MPDGCVFKNETSDSFPHPHVGKPAPTPFRPTSLLEQKVFSLLV